MTDPVRWKDSPDAPLGVGELLSVGRVSSLPAGVRERGARHVGRLAAPVALAATAATGLWSKIAAAVAIGLGATGAVVAVELASPPATDRPPVVGRAPSPAQPSAPPKTERLANATEVSPSETADDPGVRSAPEPARATAPRRAITPVAPAPPRAIVAPAAPEMPVASRTDTVAAEIALLDRARGVLAERPSDALALLAEHAAAHPDGVLARERDVLTIDALRRAGRIDDARSRAESWLGREPSGLHVARVRAMLESMR